MISANSSIYRPWLILSKIPRYPNTIGTGELRAHLQSNGFKVTARTIQRDLESLSALSLFPLSFEGQGKSYRWFWPPQAHAIALPAMDISVALAFTMCEEYLNHLLPPNTVEHLSHYFKAAHKTLNELSPNAKNWKPKVATIHGGPALIRADIRTEIQNDIYIGLFENRQLEVSYVPRNSSPKFYRIHPLGLVSKEGYFYLVGTINDYADIKQFALSRFKKTKLLNDQAVEPDGFSLQQYIQHEAGFQYPTQNTSIEVKIAVRPDMALFFHETLLSKNQEVCLLPDGRSQVTASVIPSDELEWWLLGMGSNVEVLEPLALRQSIQRRLADALNQYTEKENTKKICDLS